MAEVTRIYRQKLPKMKLVGKCYGDADKVNDTFAAKWGEWFQNDWFAPLCAAVPGDEPFPDCSAYIGLCRIKKGEPFRYWIGVFLPEDAAVPAGYDSVTLDAGDVAVCWVYGKEPDVYLCNSLDPLKAEGYTWTPDEGGVLWCFERYTCPRFTDPDEKGNIILDMCYYVQPNA